MTTSEDEDIQIKSQRFLDLDSKVTDYMIKNSWKPDDIAAYHSSNIMCMLLDNEVDIDSFITNFKQVYVSMKKMREDNSF